MQPNLAFGEVLSANDKPELENEILFERVISSYFNSPYSTKSLAHDK